MSSCGDSATAYASDLTSSGCADDRSRGCGTYSNCLMRWRSSTRMPESRAVSEKPYPPGLPALFEVVRRLRAPDGCPWDREQTHATLRPYLLEETYELLEAIDSGDDAKMMEELGDLLLQVAMHAEIAAEEGRFDVKQVSQAVAAKMVKRHPHVFGDVSVANADEVLRNWEHQKMHEARKA